MKTSTALSNGNQRVFFPFISRLSKSLAHGAFSRLIVLTALLWSVLVTSAFAEGVAANNTAGLTFWAHLVVTAFAFIFAMKLAAAAFARPPRQLADIPTGPKYLTSPGYYMFGLVIFTLLAASLFLLLLYLHTEVIAVVDLIKLPFLRVSISNTVIEAIANDTAPYLLIVFIMAALYLYLMRKEAEWNILLMLRDVIHIWIAIPYRVRAIVAQVSHTFNVPEPFANEVVRRRLGVRKEDFEKDPSTFERPWAELSYIQWWLTRQLESGEAGFFNDSEFKLDELLTEYASLSTDVARFRDDRASHVTDAAALVPRLKVLRNKSARVVGCYLVHRYGVDDRLDRAALDFGILIEATSNENPLKYIVISCLSG